MKIKFRFFGIISAMLTVLLLASCTPQVNAEVTIESVTLTEETKAKLSKIVVGSKVELVSMIKYKILGKQLQNGTGRQNAMCRLFRS